MCFCWNRTGYNEKDSDDNAFADVEGAQVNDFEVLYTKNSNKNNW